MNIADQMHCSRCGVAVDSDRCVWIDVKTMRAFCSPTCQKAGMRFNLGELPRLPLAPKFQTAAERRAFSIGYTMASDEAEVSDKQRLRLIDDLIKQRDALEKKIDGGT